jgi:hypothetical protein
MEKPVLQKYISNRVSLIFCLIKTEAELALEKGCPILYLKHVRPQLKEPR